MDSPYSDDPTLNKLKIEKLKMDKIKLISALNWCIGAIEGMGGKATYPRNVLDKVSQPEEKE